jgi:Outer membrane usher protein
MDEDLHIARGGLVANTHAGALSFDAGLGIGLDGDRGSDPGAGPAAGPGTGPDAPLGLNRTVWREHVPSRVFASRIRLGFATPLTSVSATFNAETSLRLGAGSIDLREWFANRQASERGTSAGTLADPALPLELHFRGFFTQSVRRRFTWHASLDLRLAQPAFSTQSIAGGIDHQLGAGTTFGIVSLSLNFALSHSWRHPDTAWRISLDLAVRLGHSLHAPMFSTQSSFDSARRQSRSMTLTGTLSTGLAKENRLDYALGAGCDDVTTSKTLHGALVRYSRNAMRCTQRLTLDLAYAGAPGRANATLSRSGSVMLGTGGSIVVHRGGITFGPPLGDTIALIDTQHGSGLRLSGTSLTQVDRRGYAIVPYLTPYRLNDVAIDPTNAPRGVRLGNSSRVVAPIAGAIVHVAIEAKRVDARRYRISMNDGRAPPFGAAVRTSKGERVGSMGQGGRLALAENVQGPLQIELAASHTTCRIELDGGSATGKTGEIGTSSAAATRSAVDDAPVQLECR